MDKKFNFQELQAIVATLRGENGCPWDKSQTHESLKLYTLEEAYEVNQAVTDLTKTGDCANLKEELGDLLFQVLLQSQVAEDNGEFAIEDVIDGIARKMIHRHPHVFAGRHYDSVEQDELIYKFCVQFVQKDFHFLPIANAVGRAAVSDRSFE